MAESLVRRARRAVRPPCGVLSQLQALNLGEVWQNVAAPVQRRFARLRPGLTPAIVIKRRRAAVLPAGRVVPEIPPLRVLTQDLSRCFTLDPVEVIELGEGYHGVVHFGSGLTLSAQSHALVFEHVLVPG